jgi:hypothetical protein
MMADRGHQQPKAEDTTADPSPDGASPGAIRNLILLTIAILLLAAWQAYDGFKHPESRSSHLLHAVLWLLLGAYAWVRRLRRGVLDFSKPRRGVHWTAAFAPLVVVVAFAWAQLDEGRHQAAQQARQQAVQRQRESSQLASKQVWAAMDKQREAIRVWIETSQKLKAADGKPGFRPTPDATRKLEEAKDEVNRAFERDRAERESLLRLESEFWRYR